MRVKISSFICDRVIEIQVVCNNNDCRSEVHRIFTFKVHRTGFENTDETRIKNHDPVECILHNCEMHPLLTMVHSVHDC
jgi:hypothetical protein